MAPRDDGCGRIARCRRRGLGRADLRDDLIEAGRGRSVRGGRARPAGIRRARTRLVVPRAGAAVWNACRGRFRLGADARGRQSVLLALSRGAALVVLAAATFVYGVVSVRVLAADNPW